MKIRFLTLILLLTMGLFTYSCAEGSEAASDMDQVEQEVSDAMKNMGAEITQESNEFANEFGQARKKISMRMEEIESNMEGASADARAEMKKEYNELEGWANDIDNRMNKVGDNMEKGWKDIEGDLNKNWKEFSRESEKTLNSIERYFDPEGDLE